MDATVNAKARRVFALDPRLVIGLALVATSLAGVSFIVAAME